MFSETQPVLYPYTQTSEEDFIAEMHVIVTKRQSVKIKKEEGWYSVDEMKGDLGWSQCDPHICPMLADSFWNTFYICGSIITLVVQSTNDK